MNNKLIFSLIFVGFGVACGGDDDAARRGQQGYETVQEGSAAGVTSTIQGPGETLPPLTGTNADTTTAFTIDPNAVAAATPGQQAPGTLAGTMPPPTQYPPPMTSSPPPPRPAAPPAQRERAAEPANPDTAATPPPAAPPAQPAPPTDTAPPPPPRQEEEGEEEEPPPPTSTDTRGGQAVTERNAG